MIHRVQSKSDDVKLAILRKRLANRMARNVAQKVILRYFSGMTLDDEIADAAAAARLLSA